MVLETQEGDAWGVLRRWGILFLTVLLPLISCIFRSILVTPFGFRDEKAFRHMFGMGYKQIKMLERQI